MSKGELTFKADFELRWPGDPEDEPSAEMHVVHRRLDRTQVSKLEKEYIVDAVTAMHEFGEEEAARR